MASIFFPKLLKTVCFDCEMTLFLQNLLKAVCSQNGKLVKIGKNGKPVQTGQNGIQQKLLKSVCYYHFDLF